MNHPVFKESDTPYDRARLLNWTFDKIVQSQTETADFVALYDRLIQQTSDISKLVADITNLDTSVAGILSRLNQVESKLNSIPKVTKTPYASAITLPLATILSITQVIPAGTLINVTPYSTTSLPAGVTMTVRLIGSTSAALDIQAPSATGTIPANTVGIAYTMRGY